MNEGHLNFKIILRHSLRHIRPKGHFLCVFEWNRKNVNLSICKCNVRFPSSAAIFCSFFRFLILFITVIGWRNVTWRGRLFIASNFITHTSVHSVNNDHCDYHYLVVFMLLLWYLLSTNQAAAFHRCRPTKFIHVESRTTKVRRLYVRWQIFVRRYFWPSKMGRCQPIFFVRVTSALYFYSLCWLVINFILFATFMSVTVEILFAINFHMEKLCYKNRYWC